MNITRRSLFKLGVLTGAVVSVPKAAQRLLPGVFSMQPDSLAPKGEEKWLAASCSHCGAGLRTRVVNDRVVGIKGDPKHPISQGALCPQGATLTQALYHPDRVRTPLQAVGGRGSGHWAPISWDEALSRSAEQLAAHRSKLGIFAGPTGSVALRSVLDSLATAVGGACLYEAGRRQGEGPIDAARTMMGAHSGVVCDVQHANYVLALGTDWLQASVSPIETSRAYGYLRRGRNSQRGRVAVADCRMSVSAAKADSWVPTVPATEGVLALGIAGVIVRDHLYDATFVGQHCAGFDAFCGLLAKGYTSDTVSAVTGVPADRIEALAHDFAAAKPAVALCERGSLASQAAVLALNALVGSAGQAGGVRQVVWPFGDLHLPGATEPAASAESLKAYVFAGGNPVFAHPNVWQKALSQAAFVVSLSSFLDDTAAYADLVLPIHTPLEALTDEVCWTFGGSPCWSVSAPSVPPLHDTRHVGDVLLDLAHRVGSGGTAPAWQTYDEALQAALKPVFDSKRGQQLREVALAEEDWASTGPETFDTWYKKLCQAGGWADTSGSEKPGPLSFGTASGKFEFHAELLDSAPVSPASSPDYPLHLCAYSPLSWANGDGAHLPYLQGLPGERMGHRVWETWAEIHPETAKEAGVQHGDLVRIESKAGAIQARAILFEGARPDVVSVPFGLGHSGYGRWADGIGANPADLMEADPGAVPRWRPTGVRIVKGDA